jgi:hypothetical protein
MTFSLAVSCFYREASASWPLLVIIVVGSIIAAFASSWQFWVQRMKGIRGRNWPTVSAVIDLASVQRREESGGKGPPIITWVVLLTYVYRNPEMQTGDYDRSFGNEGDAQDWADSLKGSTVMVHIDPKDPANSVLRKEELDAAVSAVDSKVNASS